MTSKQLRALSYKFFKLRKKLEPQAQKDPGLKEVFALVDKAWQDTHKLAGARELEAARKADGAEVLWTIFLPRDYGWESPRFISRTPRRNVEQRYFMDKEPHEYLASGDPWKQLEQDWKATPIEKIRERAARVDAEWRIERRRLAEAA